MNITVRTENEFLDKGITSELSNSLWNILIENTPQETGNLRMNTIRINNSPRLSRFIVNTVEAPYGEFLDKGMGRNKKHIGYFSEKTPVDMASEIVNFSITGNLMKTSVPSITLRMGKIRNYERILMNKTGFNLNQRISAHERASLGVMYNNMLNMARPIGKRSLASSMKSERPLSSYNTLFSTQERFDTNARGTRVTIK